MSTSPVGALPPGQGRAALLAEVRRALDETVADGDRVVLGVSGGPDSTALAYLLTEARPDLDACIAHVRHGLRDDAEDAAVAAAHADALGLTYHERAVQVPRAGGGPEAAARQVRYAALSEVARTVGARTVMVGHTADDQAETLLLNIARGTGPRGLAGMPMARLHTGDGGDDGPLRVVRPLLRLRRADVRDFVRGEGLPTVNDPTNRDRAQRRTRARHDLLPRLAALSGGSGDPVGALSRLADLVREDAEALDGLAATHARRLVARWGPGRALPADELSELPAALVSRVVRLMLRAVQGTTELSAATIAAVLALEPGEALHTPGGVWVTCGGGWLAAVPPGLQPLVERPLPLPGGTFVPELGVVVRTDQSGPAPPAPLAHGPPGSPHPPWGLLQFTSGAALVVRGRRSGDRLGGARLTDALSDAGVPRALRDLVPVLAEPAGRVLWVAGLAPPTGEGGEPTGAADVAALRVWLSPVDGGPRTAVV
ncbi:MAG TPA: tRNA lysidine(34) synthetase TilS [Egibacteraceae bacterium]|nr:tRNA lysidine(34) synthetase TilS [Egibacteraceae bacterium]